MRSLSSIKAAFKRQVKRRRLQKEKRKNKSSSRHMQDLRGWTIYEQMLRNPMGRYKITGYTTDHLGRRVTIMTLKDKGKNYRKQGIRHVLQ